MKSRSVVGVGTIAFKVILKVMLATCYFGCGLIFVPQINHLAEHVRTVSVQDSVTGIPISDAIVDYYGVYIRYERGLKPGPYAHGQFIADDRAYCDPLPSALNRYEWFGGVVKPIQLESAFPVAHLAPRDFIKLGTVPLNLGDFRIDPAWELGWLQIWAPLVLPLGSPIWFHEFDNVIVVRARGYGWANLTFSPHVVPKAGLIDNKDSPYAKDCVGTYRCEGDKLVFSLNRSREGQVPWEETRRPR